MLLITWCQQSQVSGIEFLCIARVHTHTDPSGLFSHSFCVLRATFPAAFGLRHLPSPLPGTYRVCVLGGRLGMWSISLQVTLKSSSWWHSQGGERHPFTPQPLGMATSSASCNMGIGLMFHGSAAISSSFTIVSFSALCVLGSPGRRRETRVGEDSLGLWLQHQGGGWRGDRRGSQVFCFPRQLSAQTSLLALLS